MEGYGYTLCARYEDGTEIVVNGTEDECLCAFAYGLKEHGKVVRFKLYAIATSVMPNIGKGIHIIRKGLVKS